MKSLRYMMLLGILAFCVKLRWLKKYTLEEQHTHFDITRVY